MKTVYLIIGLLVSSISFAQKPEEKLVNAFKAFENDSQFKHAIISLYVVDSKTGKVVFDKNSETGLAPASCLKVVTSAASFELLGKDYRYQTAFGYDGTIEGNTLNGNLIIKTSGDPALGSWRWKATVMDSVLQKIIALLKSKNIKAITGDLIVDDTKWSTQATPRGWTWDDMGNYYGAGARAFNWHENQYDLNIKPGKKVGDSVEIIGTEPLMTVALVNELTTAKSGSGDNSVIYLPEDGTIGYVRGTVGTEISKVSGSIPNVMDVFVDQLKKYLQLSDISFNGKIRREIIPPANKTQLNFHSPSFDSINYWFLQKSVNLFGEAFVKTIAYEKTGFGSTDTGINIIRDFWVKNGIEKSALHNIDGSGLSPGNRITTNALVSVMQYAKKQSWYPSFYNALPLQNGIKMKSGYIGGVRSYTGYIRSKAGTDYTFAFIINNYDGSPGAVREKMWKLLDVLK
ncbi:MAG: D-alanyl-D-alanine carboxypeptidase/D-alanyl-D-alanine-endopeptidase [Ferruginibacter sp.]|nr:D-alanyl-D-alanine carboxypeptidase/D-alanyl-D-alanine-endopeptidase [Ferruginibacter sp.]